MTRARTEHRMIAGKRIRVERGTIAVRCSGIAVQPAAVPAPEHVGPTAIDCGYALRHQPMRFPAGFFLASKGDR